MSMWKIPNGKLRIRYIQYTIAFCVHVSKDLKYKTDWYKKGNLCKIHSRSISFSFLLLLSILFVSFIYLYIFAYCLWFVVVLLSIAFAIDIFGWLKLLFFFLSFFCVPKFCVIKWNFQQRNIYIVLSMDQNWYIIQFKVYIYKHTNKRSWVVVKMALKKEQTGCGTLWIIYFSLKEKLSLIALFR